MSTAPAPDQSAQQLKRLQQKVGTLEWQLEKTTAVSGLAAVMVGGAALVVAGLALPWLVTEGRAEYGSQAQSGWSAYASESLGLVALLVLLAMVGLAAASAASRSPKLHLATHILADLSCLLPIGLLVSSLREGSSVEPGTGCYTLLIGALAVAVAAWVRRGQFEA